MSISRIPSQKTPKPCHAVREAFGVQSPTDLTELQSFPDAGEAAAQAAQHIIQETAQEPANPDLGLELGGAALQALTTLCKRCELSDICLTQGVIASTYEQQRNQHNESSTLPNTKEISHLLSLLAKNDVIIQPQDPVQLVSIRSNMKGIQLRSNALDDIELVSFSVCSDRYTTGAVIIDASPIVNSGNIQPAAPEDMKVLLNKLVSFAVAPNNRSEFQLYQTNNSAIRRINSGSTGQTTIREVRMRGKNHLYFTISRNNNGIPTIIIIGCHGSKESYQTEFLKAIGRT